MTSPKENTRLPKDAPKYIIETIQLIREYDDWRLVDLSEEQLCQLWRKYSKDYWCAGWIMLAPNRVRDFVKWATTPPYKQIEER